MTAALIAAAVLLAANLVILVPLALRRLRVPSVRVLPHPGRRAAPFMELHAGRHAASQPRQDLPRRRPLDGRAPWPVTSTAELPVLTDAATLAMYRGDWGTMPVADVREGERLASVTLP